jgi:uncharacterized membrane protein YphA (DoxX/SURF4 family)
MLATSGHRKTRLSTILLRLGLGAFLLFNGRQYAFQGPSLDGPNVASANAEGIEVDLTWQGVVGVSQMAVGGFLVLGLLTRLMTLPLLGAAGVTIAERLQSCGSICSTAAGDVTEPLKACWVNDVAAQVTPNTGMAILVGMVALSLLVSGCGGLGLDRLLFRRRSGSEPALEQLPPERLQRT